MVMIVTFHAFKNFILVVLLLNKAGVFATIHALP